MIEPQSIYRNSFNCIHLAAILDPLIEIYLLNTILISIRMVNELFLSLQRPELWNNLPEDIKSANSIDDLKRKLKTILFVRAYESWCFYFYLLCSFIYFVVSVSFQLIFVNSAFESQCRKGAI